HCCRATSCARESSRACTGIRNLPGRASRRMLPPSSSASGRRCAKVPPGNKLRRLYRRLPMKVRHSLIASLCAALAILAVSPAAPAWNRNPAVEFAELPDDPVGACRLRNPEGITVDRMTGEFYVADFDYLGTCKTGRIAVYDK